MERHYVNHANGREMAEKPEDMTQLWGDRLVHKDHPRIVFRGKLDTLQAHVVTAQAMMEAHGGPAGVVDDLEEVLGLLRELMRAEVLDEAPRVETLLGLTPAELRAQSHDPKGHFGLEPMLLPHRSMGLAYALVNGLRGEAREMETAGVAAFKTRATPAQREILRWLNRLSSALHIMMCRILTGRYGG